MRTPKPSGRNPKSASELKRKKPSREEKKRVLIVCEGKKSEPNYFTDICQDLKISAEVTIVPGSESGTHPKSIVKYAKEKRRGFDSVWCVYDKDVHENIHEAHKQAEDNGFKIAFSNPCFELWILLHYEDQRAEIDRHACQRQAREYIPEYEKGMKGVFNIIKKHQNDALKRAPNLRDENNKNDKKETDNPSTTVDKLIVYLNSISSAKPRR